MRRRIHAWLNLAYRFAIHSARLPLRPLWRGRDAARFRDAVTREGYVPLEAAERDAMPALMGCIHCGLCVLACPALREAPTSAWAETWTFIVGESRSIDRPGLLDAPPCTRCGECAAVCPADVPIPRLAAIADRLAAVARG